MLAPTMGICLDAALSGRVGGAYFPFELIPSGFDASHGVALDNGG